MPLSMLKKISLLITYLWVWKAFCHRYPQKWTCTVYDTQQSPYARLRWVGIREHGDEKSSYLLRSSTSSTREAIWGFVKNRKWYYWFVWVTANAVGFTVPLIDQALIYIANSYFMPRQRVNPIISSPNLYGYNFAYHRSLQFNMIPNDF